MYFKPCDTAGKETCATSTEGHGAHDSVSCVSGHENSQRARDRVVRSSIKWHAAAEFLFGGVMRLVRQDSFLGAPAAAALLAADFFNPRAFTG